MAAPKYIERDPSSGQLTEVIATEIGPAAEVIVSTTAGGKIDSSLLPSSGGSSRATATITATSLAAGAVAQGTISLAKTFSLLIFVANVSARLRLYSTTAARDSDVMRDPTMPVDNSTQNGVICDILLNGTTGLTWVLNPTAYGCDAASVPTGDIAYNLTNLSGVQQTVTATLTYLSEES